MKLEARVAILEARTDESRKDSLFRDEKIKSSNRSLPILDRKGNDTRQNL